MPYPKVKPNKALKLDKDSIMGLPKVVLLPKVGKSLPKLSFLSPIDYSSSMGKVLDRVFDYIE